MLHFLLVASCLFSIPLASGLPFLPVARNYSQPGAPWGLARLSHYSWNYDKNGDTQYSNPVNAYFYHDSSSPVTIYMLDTGVDVTHPELDGRASFGHSFVDGEAVGDTNGHGTHLAGIAIGKTKGVARSASLVSVKILDSRREGTVDSLSKAVDWIIDDSKLKGGKAVINYSAVGDISEYRADAISKATSNGILVVNAAGNNGSNSCLFGPADMGPSHPGLIVVAALNFTNTPAQFSNFGACIDVWAPGVDIQSSLPGGGYGYMDGTSNAAAFVSGLAAYLWAENPNLTLKEMTEAIIQANPSAIDVSGTTGAVAYNYFFNQTVS